MFGYKPKLDYYIKLRNLIHAYLRWIYLTEIKFR